MAAESDRPFQIWMWNQSRWLYVIWSCTTVTTTEPHVMRAPQRREGAFPLLQCALRASSFPLQAGARVFLSPMSPCVTSLSPLAQPKSKSRSWNCPKYRTENRTWSYIFRTRTHKLGLLEMKVLYIVLKPSFRTSVGVALTLEIYKTVVVFDTSSDDVWKKMLVC